MIRKKEFLSIIILSLVIMVILIIHFLLNDYNKICSNNSNQKMNISISRIEEILIKNITNREIIKNNYYIYIGENKKQIENEYYDIKICIDERRKIVININKLWKEFNTNLYEEEFLNEISAGIADILKINKYKENISKFMLEGYILAKSQNRYETFSNNINLCGYKFEESINNKELCIVIDKII